RTHAGWHAPARCRRARKSGAACRRPAGHVWSSPTRLLLHVRFSAPTQLARANTAGGRRSPDSRRRHPVGCRRPSGLPRVLNQRLRPEGSWAIISIPGVWTHHAAPPVAADCRGRYLRCRPFTPPRGGQRRPMRTISRLEDADQLDSTVAVGQRVARWIRPGKLRDALHGVWLGHPLHPVLVQTPIGMWLSASALDLLAPRAD